MGSNSRKFINRNDSLRIVGNKQLYLKMTYSWLSFLLNQGFYAIICIIKRQSYIDEKFNQEMTFRVKEGKHIQQ